jgi:hypothetical protein
MKSRTLARDSDTLSNAVDSRNTTSPSIPLGWLEALLHNGFLYFIYQTIEHRSVSYPCTTDTDLPAYAYVVRSVTETLTPTNMSVKTLCVTISQMQEGCRAINNLIELNISGTIRIEIKAMKGRNGKDESKLQRLSLYDAFPR